MFARWLSLRCGASGVTFSRLAGTFAVVRREEIVSVCLERCKDCLPAFVAG